jgi:hypothetical protein
MLQSQNTDTRVRVAPCPMPIFLLSVDATGAGGLTVTSVVEAYSSKNGGSWLTVQPLNVARHSFATMVVGDAVWVVGGLGVGDVVLNSIEVYNVTSNKWTIIEGEC